MQENSKSVSKLILIIICLIEAIIILCLLNTDKRTTVTPPDVIVKEIVRDSIIRDSIFIVNEKIKREIVYVEKTFKQDSLDIMSANDSTLLSNFARYIEDYDNK
jgi:hypothetical protein